MRYLVKAVSVLMAVAVISACSSDEEKKASHLEKGKSYFQKGEYKSAELELKSAIQIDPKYVDAYMALGGASLKLGNPQGAFNAYSAVVKIDPDNTDAQLKLATLYMLSRKIKEATGKIDAVLAKAPNNIEALFLRGNILGMEKNLFGAASVFEKIIEIDSKQTRAYLGLARVQARQGKFSEAEKILKQGINNAPKEYPFALPLLNFISVEEILIVPKQRLSEPSMQIQRIKIFILYWVIFISGKKISARPRLLIRSPSK